MSGYTRLNWIRNTTIRVEVGVTHIVVKMVDGLNMCGEELYKHH